MLLKISTPKKQQILDITEQIEEHLEGSGLASIFVKHTTAAVTAADLDPGTDLDILDALKEMTPNKQWRHPHDPSHFPDHLWAAIIGPNLMVPFTGSRLLLGTWQRVILIEFDGPREREIELTFI